MEVTILSVNCQGLGSIEKRRDVFDYLKSKSCHINCLQDIQSSPTTENNIQTQWNYQCLFSSASSNSRGVAILFNKGFEYKIHQIFSDPNGNYIIVEITMEKNWLTLINLYGPNTDSPTFFENLLNIADPLNNNIIMCGDYNLVQDPTLDYNNYFVIYEHFM